MYKTGHHGLSNRLARPCAPGMLRVRGLPSDYRTRRYRAADLLGKKCELPGNAQ